MPSKTPIDHLDFNPNPSDELEVKIKSYRTIHDQLFVVSKKLWQFPTNNRYVAIDELKDRLLEQATELIDIAATTTPPEETNISHSHTAKTMRLMYGITRMVNEDISTGLAAITGKFDTFQPVTEVALPKEEDDDALATFDQDVCDQFIALHADTCKASIEEAIFEQFEAFFTQPKFKYADKAKNLGRHALDVAKIAAGNYIALRLTKRFKD